MTRPYGNLKLKWGQWYLTAEPHLLIRAKRVFGKANEKRARRISFQDSDEIRRDLLWFMDRYPLKVADREMRLLTEGAKRHTDSILRMEDILSGKALAPKFELAVPAREYQRQAAQLYLERGFLLLGDELGIGKTVSAICSFTDQRTLPAVVVCLAGTLQRQWEREINRFAPALSTHIIQKTKPYPLDFMGRLPDVLILTYHKLRTWAAILMEYANSVVFDEIQDLRRRESRKYQAAVELSRSVDFRLGMSATPIYNYGGELWNVMHVIRRDCLGTWSEFSREWCGNAWNPEKSIVREPRALGSYLRENGYLLRRSRKDVGRELPPVSRVAHEVGHDHRKLKDVEESAKTLAEIILSGTASAQDRFRASEELSWQLRQATGIAKAPYVADFLKMLVDSGQKILVYLWHRAVYDILESCLKDTVRVARYSGSEGVSAKEKAQDAFVDGDAQVLLMSLRAGAGVDGLQKSCSTIVFAELDWSAGVHEQCIGRIDRDGQESPVVAYYLVAEDGSDPVVAETLGLKREQVEGIRDPDADSWDTAQTDPQRIRSLAKAYLEKRGLTPTGAKR